jgi:hypothetical protein
MMSVIATVASAGPAGGRGEREQAGLVLVMVLSE